MFSLLKILLQKKSPIPVIRLKRFSCIRSSLHDRRTNYRVAACNLGHRRDVLVKPEQLGWVVTSLDHPQLLPGQAKVGGTHAYWPLFTEDVDVGTGVALI